MAVTTNTTNDQSQSMDSQTNDTQDGHTNFVESGTKWQRTTKSSLDRARRLRYDGELSDVTIWLTNADPNSLDTQEPKQTYKCHKQTLASCSPVFQKMFAGNEDQPMSLSDLSLAREIFEVADMSAQTFEKMLDYMYLDEDITVHLQSTKEAIELFDGAVLYQIDHLAETVLDFILGKTTIDNAITVLNFTSQIEDVFAVQKAKLQYKALGIVREHASQLLKEPIPHIKPETISLILSEDNLNATEPQVLQFVLKWGEMECMRLAGTVSGENIRVTLDKHSLLKLIRFRRFTAEEFNSIAADKGIFTPEESYLIVCLIVGVRVKAPDVISSERNPDRANLLIEDVDVLWKFAKSAVTIPSPLYLAFIIVIVLLGMSISFIIRSQNVTFTLDKICQQFQKNDRIKYFCGEFKRTENGENDLLRFLNHHCDL